MIHRMEYATRILLAAERIFRIQQDPTAYDSSIAFTNAVQFVSKFGDIQLDIDNAFNRILEI